MAGVVDAAENQPHRAKSELALHGGEKAVKATPQLPVRWGDPERERLNAMLAQDSLFYWKGPQTSLFIEFGDKGFDRLKGGLWESFATNYRMSEPQAAVAAAQLNRLEGIISSRAKLGNALTKQISGLRGVRPHEVHPQDRCGYWFYMFRIDPGAFRCDRAEFVKALAAEGVPASAGYIPVPLHQNPVFQKHGFFAGRWPIKELGLTAMDYSRHQTPEVEAILQTGVRLTLHERMTDDYISNVAEAIHKVAKHYAA